MAKLVSAASSQGHQAVHLMFEAGGPVLVEVRHPGGVFSSDWRLVDSDDEFDAASTFSGSLTNKKRRASG